MTNELAPIDIRQVPGLAQLAEEVQQTGKSRRLIRDNEEIAVLRPLGKRQGARRRIGGPSITEQTAGIFKQYRLARPLTPREERAAFEQGVADEVSGGPED
jgi:hypothetical protein